MAASYAEGKGLEWVADSERGDAMLFRTILLVLFTALCSAFCWAGPNDVAIIIGNRDYTGATPKVEFAERDADAFARAAQEVLDIPAHNIIRINNATATVFRRWFGENGGGTEQLARLLKSRNASLYIYYSGHGLPADGGDVQASLKMLLPVDADPQRVRQEGYPLSWIREAARTVQTQKAPEGRAVLFIDACFSGSSSAGTLVKDSSGVSMSASRIREVAPERVIEFTASAADEVAYWDRTRQHGLFTDAVLDGLYGAAAERDGRVSLAGLASYVSREVDQRLSRLFPSERRRQTPMVLGDQSIVFAVRKGAQRDPEGMAREQTMCRLLMRSNEQSEIKSFIESCRACACVEDLRARMTLISKADEVCRVEGDYLQRMANRTSASMDDFQSFAREAQCERIKKRAEEEAERRRPAPIVRAPTPPPPPQNHTNPAPRCGWYAIAYCSREYSAVEGVNQQVRGVIVNTSDRAAYPNFASGWYCASHGPMDRSTALARAEQLKREGYPTAYAKNSC